MLRRAFMGLTFLLAAYAAINSTPSVKAQVRQLFWFAGTAEQPGLAIQGTRSGFFAKGSSAIGVSVNGTEVASWSDRGSNIIPDPVDGHPEVTTGNGEQPIAGAGINLYQEFTDTANWNRTGFQNGFFATSSAGTGTPLRMDLFADNRLAVGSGCGSNSGIGFWVQGARQWCIDTAGDLSSAGSHSVSASVGFFTNTTGIGAAAASASLPADVNGRIRYCTDCNPDATCTGAGAGAFAFRINGAWTCELN